MVKASIQQIKNNTLYFLKIWCGPRAPSVACRAHLCYKTDFLFAKSWGPKFFQMYYCEYLMNILCKYEKKKEEN